MAWAVEAGPTEFNGDGSSDPIDVAFDSGTGSNRLLVVVVTIYRDGGVHVAGITYNGVSMTASAEVDVNQAQEQRIYSLVAPATGSNTLSVDIGVGTYPSLSAAVVCFTGIEQTPTINDTGTASGFGTSQLITLDPTEAGDLVIFAGSASTTVTWIADSGDTKFADDSYGTDAGSVNQGASYRLADAVTEAGRVTASASSNSQAVAIAFKSAPASGTVPISPLYSRRRRRMPA